MRGEKGCGRHRSLRKGRRGLFRRLPAAVLLLAGLFPGGGRAHPFVLATWDFDGLAAIAAAGQGEGDPLILERGGKDLAALARYAARLDPDIIALEGVASEEAARSLFPPERYTLAFADIPPPFTLGFAVRRALALTRHPDLTALDVYGPEARRHLRAGADITVSGPDLPPLRLLAVHLKAGCRHGPGAEGERAACRVLSAQLEVIARWIAAREEAHEAFAVLGDFNLGTEGRVSLVEALGTEGLREATEGLASPCWGGEPLVDRIVLGGPARAWLVPESLRVLVYRETGRAARARLSGHCPLALRLDPARGGAEEEAR